jgi:carboxypeptidase family protein
VGAAATLVALLCLASFAPAAARAATGSISGTVTDAASAEPLEGVEVCASPESEEGPSPCSFTETDGTYSIGGLDPGGYKVWFWAGQRYVFEYFDGKHEWFEADSVAVLGGADTPEIDADLEPTAAIEGTVTAADGGLPVEEVEVCAYPVDPSEESFFECSETAADGTYAIAGLNPGSYQVEFWTGWTSSPFAYEFWNDESRYAEADVVALAASERREGIDAELEPGAGISGSVTDLATGLPIEDVRVCSIDATIDKLTICIRTNEAGKYRIRSLPAGPYKVVFSPELWEFFPGEAFPGEDDDGYPTQFWSNQTTIGAANVLSLPIGGQATGIDAHFGIAPAPPALTPPVKAPVHKKRRCRRGYKKKLIHGKRRCVKVHRHRRHRHKKHTQAQARYFVR